MTVDTTLSFAARRNVPIRYNRDLVATTLKAMQRVSEIRSKRERQFYRARMRGNKAKQREADRKLVAEHQHLLPPHERDVVPEHLLEKEAQKMEVEKQSVPVEEDMELEEALRLEEEERQLMGKKAKSRKKSRLIVGQGPEDMDVDG